MARPTTIRGSKLLIKIGNGATPEVFTAPCALNAKSFNRSASTNDFNVADCDDPDAPVWTERAKEALSAGITGSGTLAQESLDLWEDFYDNQDPQNVQIVLDYEVGPRTYQMAAFLTTLNISGNQGELAQIEVEIASHGEVVKL
jgi:hypothetical protein